MSDERTQQATAGGGGGAAANQAAAALPGRAAERRLHADGVRVDVLEHIFGMDRTTATRVMLEVHTRGKGICGVYTYEIAETKVRR